MSQTEGERNDVDRGAETGAQETAGQERGLPAEQPSGTGEQVRKPVDLPALTDDPGEGSGSGESREGSGPSGGSDTYRQPVRVTFADTDVQPDPARGPWSRPDNNILVDRDSKALAVPDGADTSTEAAYRSPEDVREAFMEGKSVPDVRRELADQAPGPSEPTTELYREQDGLRYELGTPPEAPGEMDKILRRNTDKSSRYDKGLDELSKGQTIGDAKDIANTIADTYARLAEPPRPEGTYTGNPDRPAISETPKNGIHGDVATAVLVTWLLIDRGVRSIGHKVHEWKQSRGDREDAGN